MTTDDRSAELIVRVRHLRTCPSFTARPGFCMRGARSWFASRGLDWAAFVRDGIPAHRLTATGDALALRLVEHARVSGE